MTSELQNCCTSALGSQCHYRPDYISVMEYTPFSGRFICLIDGHEYLGRVVQDMSRSFFRRTDEVVFNPSRIFANHWFDGVGWIKPPGLNDPTHWYPLPEIPK